MEFRFDATQEYQLAAIEAACGLLEGQPYLRSELVIPEGASFSAIANRLDLSEDTLLKNLQDVQAGNGIDTDDELKVIAGSLPASGETTPRPFPNFSVEMETGTGKTYVYLRTAMEMFKRFGLRKFIVVVPSVAVREGVLATLQDTQSHLRALYDNPPYRYYAYDSANLSQVRQFAMSDGLEIMVMTIDAFARAENVIRQTTDRLQGERPLNLIQATRPVLVLDEPQNMESENRIAALASLHPLFALRYSATHRNPYNLIYRLTPYDAYRQGLVKRIEIASVIEEDNQNRPFVRLDEIKIQAKKPVARLAVHKLMKSGAIKETILTIKGEDDLEKKTGRVKERSQLHKIIEDNTWLFGEEYNLSVSDRGLTAVLDKHRKLLGEDVVIDKPVKHISQERGIVDLMLSRVLRRHRADELEHLVVELKRPKVTIGDEEVTQVEKYAISVANDERFRTVDGVRWTFWAISDDVDQYAAYRMGDRGVISSKNNITVGIKTWGQVIEENKARLQFFQEKLEHQVDDETALKHLQEKYQKFLAGVVTEGETDTEGGEAAGPLAADA